MIKHRSIGERLDRARSPEAIRETLRDWVANWHDDQKNIVAQFEYGTSHMDSDVLATATGQLKAVTQKRFEALAKIIERLTQ